MNYLYLDFIKTRVLNLKHADSCKYASAISNEENDISNLIIITELRISEN